MGEAWISRELAGSGLSSSAAYMILELVEAGPLNLTELGRRVAVDVAHVTRVVRSLEARGFIRREADPADRRSSILTLTEEGRRVAGMAEEIILAWVDILIAGIDPADVEITGRTLSLFYENAFRRNEGDGRA